ncbi:MAG: diguanylate cyclase, partial [Nitrospinota bacterium]
DELLSESVGNYYTLFENSKDTVYITSEDGRILDINQAGVDLFGYSKEKLLDIGIIPLYKNPNNRTEFVKIIKERNFVKDYEVDLVNSKGETIHTLITAIVQKSTVDGTLLFQGIIRDITESKHAELALIRKNRALSAISQCNNKLVHATTEEQLLNDICQIITEVGGYRMAWAGYTMTDRQKSVKPIAHSGFEDGYLDTLGITLKDTERGHGPVGSSIRTGQPVIIRNIQTDSAFKPWRSEAAKRGYTSVASLPLLDGKRCFGALSICSSEENAFDDEEIGLLRELANNLSFGILALRDRVERKRAQEKLGRSLSLLQATLESTTDGILVVDMEGKTVSFNRVFLKMWQIPDSIASTKDDSKLVEFVLDQLKNPDEFLKKIKELYEKPESTSFDHIEFRNGKTFERYSLPQMIGDKVVGRVWSFRDITERKRQEDRISFMAFHDPLTGLPNRRTFTDRLTRELIHAKRNKSKGAVMFMDLDCFKEVNDTMGHDVGDVLLQHVAMRIQRCLREEDTVSRIGGDEFVVVLSKIKDEEDSLLVAKKIIETVKETIKIENREVNTTVSIGISIFPTDGEEPEILIKRADDAMYIVKREGRNNVRLYTQG